MLCEKNNPCNIKQMPAGINSLSNIARPMPFCPEPARIIPSDRPNFIRRGLRLATTIILAATSSSGSGYPDDSDTQVDP